MRPAFGTVLQVAGIAAVCVFTFAISYKIGGIAAGVASIYVGLAADR